MEVTNEVERKSKRNMKDIRGAEVLLINSISRHNIARMEGLREWV